MYGGNPAAPHWYGHNLNGRVWKTQAQLFSSPCVVASVLNPETTQAVLGSKPMGQRKRSSSLPEEEAVTVEAVLQHLEDFYTTMSLHGVDSHLVKQVVKQLYYIICTMSFNHLLLRKNMCSWSTGLQIRSGLSVARSGLCKRRRRPGPR